ncbi:universal stress protein [Streptomyces sp. NPDC023998]|uniref:universal stress protein n=1 Tax=Streptomyces sp. NPDC023998 TaxID=3154597 RepID=UPI0033ECDD6F
MAAPRGPVRGRGGGCAGAPTAALGNNGELVGEVPGCALTHEVVRGHPVEELARDSEHALAVVVGRRGRGGYTGIQLGPVVHGLLHRALCPVITVPTP